MKPKTNMVKVDNTFEFVLLCSMRYAIGRTSYAPCLIASYIQDVWDKLSQNSKCLMQTDLEKNIDDADRLVKGKLIDYDPLGNKCDRQTWKTLNDWMKERL